MSEKRTERPMLDPRVGRFSERLKEAMGGMSVRSLSTKVRPSEGTLRSYLRGDTFPDLPDFWDICKVLGRDPVWMATGEGSTSYSVAEPATPWHADRNSAREHLRASETTYRAALDAVDWEPPVLIREGVRTAIYAHGLTLEGAIYLLDMHRRQAELDADG
jgi:hypothetical protein